MMGNNVPFVYELNIKPPATPQRRVTFPSDYMAFGWLNLAPFWKTSW